MLSYLNLSSSVRGHKGSFSKPSWGEVYDLLIKLKSSKGTVSLSVIDGPEIGPDSLQVRADNKRFMISMLDNISEYDDEVRSYTNPSEVPGVKKVEILGDFWDASMVSDDIDLVIKIFKEFYETGNVSRTLLD